MTDPASTVLQEEAALAFDKAAVAFQFVTRLVDPSAVDEMRDARRRYCPFYNSYERDLLSYAYRDSPPMRSCVHDNEFERSVEVVLPGVVRFCSEGENYVLKLPGDSERRLHGRLYASRCDFPASWRTVLNLVLRFDPGETRG